MEELIRRLNTFEPRYRSVAFEGASMGVALVQGLGVWEHYASAAATHATQVHIGLGWAIAQPPIPPKDGLALSDILPHIEPELRVKVLDGFGYWHGLFHRRATIRTQQLPEHITAPLQAGFDQGVGRAIWYITKGDISKVLNIISHFAEGRKADLWQGIGVALTYVGGCSDEMIFELKTASSMYKSHVDHGINLAEASLRKAQT